MGEAIEPTSLTIRTLNENDRDAALRIINSAASWYGEILPPEEAAGPEMTPKDWAAESQRMTWFGACAGTKLIGVIGLEYRLDVALLRHWYVRPEQQRTGAGSLLREHLERAASGVERLVAGTYWDNYKARGALEGGGWRLSDDSQAVLSAYYDITPERALSSVTYERAVDHQD